MIEHEAFAALQAENARLVELLKSHGLKLPALLSTASPLVPLA
jgi:hypothetical protein